MQLSQSQSLFLRASLERMADRNVQPLPESMLREVIERIPDLAEFAYRALAVHYCQSQTAPVVPYVCPMEPAARPFVPFVPTADYVDGAAEAEGEALAWFAENVGQALPANPVTVRAERFGKLEGRRSLPRYSRRKAIRAWARICAAFDQWAQTGIYPDFLKRSDARKIINALPLTKRDKARRAVKQMRKLMIRSGQATRDDINKVLAQLSAALAKH